MAQCKSCRKVGFFFNVPKYGICIDCLNTIKQNYQLILPVIQELIDTAEDADNIETIITQLDVAIQHTKDMMKYDSYGVIDLSPQLRELKNKKQKLIYKQFLAGYEKVRSRTDDNIPSDVKTNILLQYKSELQKYSHLLSNYNSDINLICQAVDYEIAGYAKKRA